MERCNMKNKLIALALITALTSTLLIGCGDKKTMKATIYFHGEIKEIETKHWWIGNGVINIIDIEGTEYIVDSKNVLLEDM